MRIKSNSRQKCNGTGCDEVSSIAGERENPHRQWKKEADVKDGCWRDMVINFGELWKHIETRIVTLEKC